MRLIERVSNYLPPLGQGVTGAGSCLPLALAEVLVWRRKFSHVDPFSSGM